MSQKDWIEKDFYKVLGVPKDASQDDIKKAFRKLAKKNHPDSNENDPKAEARFKESSEAYDGLSSETKSKEYDEARSLFGSGGFRMPQGGFNPNAGGQGGGVPFDLSDLLGLRQLNRRTSTGALQATAALRAHASASSRSAASSTHNPPTCSMVSRYGPSVTSTVPFALARSDFALLAGCKPPTKTLTPATFISALSASISRDIASSSATDGS